MFKRLSAIFLSIVIILGGVSSSYASSGADIIYDILNKDNKANSDCTSIIYNILNGEKVGNEKKVKLVTYDEVKDVEKEDTKFSLDIKDRSNSYIMGLDISKHNGVIDWDSVKKANIKFVVIRAGYGTNPNSDIMFKRNIQEAVENDMIIGIYWFSYAYTNDMAKREANACLKAISKYKENITLPVFFDFEYDSVKYANKNGVYINKAKCSKFAEIFCDTIKDQGYQVGIYTNLDYATNYFTRDTLDKYHTWVADWRSSCAYKYKYIMWQCTDNKWINGKRFDLNRLYFKKYEKRVNGNE